MYREPQNIEYYQERFENVFHTTTAFEEINRILDEKVPPDKKMTLMERIRHFLQYFDIFEDIPAIFEEIFHAIVTSLELVVEGDVDELEQLLQKTILLRFVEAYVTYAQLGQKEKILNILSTSLETLAAPALFLNLGLLVKPIYTSEEYLKQKDTQATKEIDYKTEYVTGDAELWIKHEIDEWIHAQTLDLDKQDDLFAGLHQKYDRLCVQQGIAKNADNYPILKSQVEEMLTMQLTVVSLGGFMDDDEDLKPVPIS